MFTAARPSTTGERHWFASVKMYRGQCLSKFASRWLAELVGDMHEDIIAGSAPSTYGRHQHLHTTLRSTPCPETWCVLAGCVGHRGVDDITKVAVIVSLHSNAHKYRQALRCQVAERVESNCLPPRYPASSALHHARDRRSQASSQSDARTCQAINTIMLTVAGALELG